MRRNHGHGANVKKGGRMKTKEGAKKKVDGKRVWKGKKAPKRKWCINKLTRRWMNGTGLGKK